MLDFFATTGERIVRWLGKMYRRAVSLDTEQTLYVITRSMAVVLAILFFRVWHLMSVTMGDVAIAAGILTAWAQVLSEPTKVQA